MIKSIDHINIVVENLKEVTNFFTEVLGFSATEPFPLQGDWIDNVVKLEGVEAEFVILELTGESTKIELLKYHQPASNEKNPRLANGLGFRHIAFNVSEIEDLYSKLSQKEVEIFSEIFIYNNKKKLFYIYGPENIILEFAEYGEF